MNENAPASERRPFEAWAQQKNTPAWLLAATRVKARWPQGQELSEDQFDQAVDAAANERIG